MVLEPLTGSLAVLGSVLGIIGAVSGTVENVAVRAVDFNRCSESLRSYEQQLDYCRTVLLNWHDKWQIPPRGPDLERARCEEIWGTIGCLDVTDRWMLITLKAQSFYEELSGTHSQAKAIGVDPALLKEWKHFCRRPMSKQHVPKYRKLVHALWQKRLVHNDITSLRTDVENLEKQSDFYYDEKHLNDGSKTQDIDQVLMWRHRAGWFAEYLRKIQQDQKMTNDVWSLVLRLPDDRGRTDCNRCIRCLQIGNPVHIQFVRRAKIEPTSIAFDNFNTVTYRYKGMSHADRKATSTTGMPPKSLRNQILCFADESEVTMCGAAVKSYIRTIDDNVRRLERTETALGLINWGLLMIETGWLADPSILCIHQVHLETESSTLAGTRSYYAIDSKLRESYDPARQFLRLGMVLAEVATGKPFKSVKIKRWEDMVFTTQSHAEIWKEDVFELVHDNMKMHHYRDAIVTCFQLYHFLSRKHEGEQVVSIALLKRALEQILEPMQTYYNALAAYRKAQPKGWRRKLQSSGSDNSISSRT